MPEAQPRALREGFCARWSSRPRLLTGLEFFSYNATKDLLCRSTVQSTSHCRTFSIGTHTTVKVRLQEIVAVIGACESVRRRSTDQYHSPPKRIFFRTMCFGKAKRRLSRSNGERFPPCFGRWWRCCQHYALIMSIALSLATLFWCSLPFLQNNFLRNWNTKLAEFFTSLVCLV